MTGWLGPAVVAWATCTPAAPVGTATVTLHLETVLDSVESVFPLLLAAERKLEAARGEAQSARGAFDLKLEADGGYDPTGFYDGARAGVKLEQPTTLWGLSVFGGYRYGEDFPVYYGDRATSESGEILAGLSLPLWRDGPIDANRLAIRLAELGIDVASLDVDVKRLELYDKAARAYWKWVATGEKLRIDEERLSLAEARMAYVRSRIEQGALPAIELVDNERLALERRQLVVQSKAKLQRAALKLSLFLRDRDGRPVRPSRALLPRLPDAVGGLPNVRAFVEEGLRGRPELTRLGRRRQGLSSQLDYFENQRAPDIRLELKVSKDLGDTRPYTPSLDFDSAFATKGETEVGLNLSLSLPVQQRKARGKAAATRAKISQIDLERGYVADAVEVQVRDAHTALVAARDNADLARQAYALTLRLERAERRKFDLGQTTIFVVNLREEATAKAAKALVDALEAYHDARAGLAVASGGRPRSVED